MSIRWWRTSGMLVGTAAILACSSSNTTSPGNTCGQSGAAANITANSSPAFAPAAATISAGQSVCWQNQSGLAQTVRSDDGSSFNSPLPSGSTFVHSFPTVGIYAYHSSTYPAMIGTITVH